MNYLLPWRRFQVAFCLVLLSVVPASEAFAEPLATSHDAMYHSDATPLSTAENDIYPESPGATQLQAAPQQAPGTPQQQQQTPKTVPTGTAAAPDEQPAGVAASKPSGSAIAPAKQKRIRTYAVRTALIVGAAVAIGVVVGASLASPSRAQ
jgi:hypothetical protein